MSAPVWESASLASATAVARVTSVCAIAVVVAAAVALAGGWRWTVGVGLGGGAALAVLWVSVRVLLAGARRLSPPVMLLVALAVYVVAVVGLFLAAVAGRSAGWLEPVGVAAGGLGTALLWTAGLLAVHVRHDRPARPDRRRGRGRPPAS